MIDVEKVLERTDELIRERWRVLYPDSEPAIDLGLLKFDIVKHMAIASALEELRRYQ